jgi:RNA polymerase sigma factor (sigma-70 family)
MMDDSRSATVPPGRSDRSARLADLLDAARGGNDDAIGQITAELSPMLWHVARAAGLNTDDAEDVVQTVWERLLSHLGDIRVPPSLVSWLVVTTRHEAWRIRSTGRRQLPADQEWLTDLPDHATGTEEQVVIDEQHRALWLAFGKLSAQCQELLRIVALVPRPDYQSVSARLGMPVGSIGPTRGRCLDKIRALLTDERDGTKT